MNKEKTNPILALSIIFTVTIISVIASAAIVSIVLMDSAETKEVEQLQKENNALIVSVESRKECQMLADSGIFTDVETRQVYDLTKAEQIKLEKNCLEFANYMETTPSQDLIDENVAFAVDMGKISIDKTDPNWQCKKTLGIYKLAKQAYPHFIENAKWLADKHCGFDVSNIAP